MLEPYYGEFLISPIPLELSMAGCAHACSYCFARLGKPDARQDVREVLRLIADYPNRRTLAARLLQDRYPVLLSNKTDPFAANQYHNTAPIVELLTGLGIPVTFQTKGGPGVAEVLQWLPAPTLWYWTLTTLDEARAARLEPGAPAPAERLRQMAACREAGHKVVVGFNPCVPEWQPDAKALLAAAQVAGAEGAWITRLHLNSKQAANLAPAQRQAMGEPAVHAAMKRRTSPRHFDFILRTREEAKALGLHVYTAGQPDRSEFWALYRSCYPKTYPNLQDWVNWCHDHLPDGGLVTFADFAAVLMPGLPDVAQLDGSKYLMTCTSNHTWNECGMKAGMDYAEVLRWVWREPRVSRCPAAKPAFAFAGRQDADGWTVYVDEDGLPLMQFVPGGTSEWFVEA